MTSTASTTFLSKISDVAGPDFFPCLFGISDYTFCSYNPHDPSIYFSLGEALAAIAILFAVVQLFDHSWKVVLLIRPLYHKIIPYLFLILGILLVMFSSILPQFYLINPPFNYPIIYELSAMICFILSPFILWQLAVRKKRLFNLKTHENFFQCLLTETGRIDNAKNIETIINLVGANLESIVNFVKLDNESKEDSNENECRINAMGVLNIVLSDARVASYIATARYDFLLHYLDILRKNNIFRETNTSMEIILKNLFENSNSFLYRQLDRNGLSMVENNIYNIFFEDYTILKGYDCLNQWNNLQCQKDQYTNLNYLPVYLNSLKYALKGYWGTESMRTSPRTFYNAFSRPIRYLERIGYLYSQNKVDEEFLFDKIHDLESFLHRDFFSLYEEALRKGRVTEFDKKLNLENGRYPNNIKAYYVEAVFDFINFLASLFKYNFDEQVRLCAIELMDKIFKISEDSESYDMKKYFEKLLWEKINENIKYGYFPPILRVYASVFGFKVGDGNNWRNEERKKIINCLYEKLKPQIISNRKMVNHKFYMEDVLLPRFIKYNRENERFEWIMDSENNQIL